MCTQMNLFWVSQRRRRIFEWAGGIVQNGADASLHLLMDPLLQLGRRMRTNVFAAREHSERWRDVRVQEIDADEDRPRRRPEYIPVAHCK